MDYLQAFILAVIEGLTGFLPVSSTGHMVIASSFMGIGNDDFVKLYEVAIQLGAIIAVVVLYWKKFFDFSKWQFYLKLVIAVTPALMFGKLLNDFIDDKLGNPVFIAIVLLVGGIILLFIDKLFHESEETGSNEVSYKTAFNVGLFQTIAMIPGVSRSAATIIGGLTQKLNKKTAAEFSFFLAVPTMLAATLYKLLKFYLGGYTFGSHEISILAFGNVAAFIVAILAIKSFISYLTSHGFKLFGYYRIALGVIILALYWLGIDLSIV